MRLPQLSACILALNEAAFVERAIDSVKWADEVVVIDSGSTDGTQQLAEAAGASLVSQPWLGYSGQRNAAAAAARNDWIFFIDADEVVTSALRTSIERTLAGQPDPRDGYAVERRNEWLGRLLPNDQRREKVRAYVRLYNRRHSQWDPDVLVHESVIVPGKRHLLHGTLVQWRPESLAEYTARAMRYAGVEAQSAHEQGATSPARIKLGALPPLRLIWLLVVQGNVRLGTAGVLHALHKVNAEWVRQLALLDLRQERGFHGDTVVPAMNDQNLSAYRAGPRPTRQIWAAAPRLAIPALRAMTSHHGPDALAAYLRWNQVWLTAGKAWESTRLADSAISPFDGPNRRTRHR